MCRVGDSLACGWPIAAVPELEPGDAQIFLKEATTMAFDDMIINVGFASGFLPASEAPCEAWQKARTAHRAGAQDRFRFEDLLARTEDPAGACKTVGLAQSAQD
jgi:hypothetical protein